jgi:hypothetical protein
MPLQTEQNWYHIRMINNRGDSNQHFNQRPLSEFQSQTRTQTRSETSKVQSSPEYSHAENSSSAPIEGSTEAVHEAVINQSPSANSTPVTVELPLEIVRAIHQHYQQPEQAGKISTEAILEVLRSAVQSSAVQSSITQTSTLQTSTIQTSTVPSRLLPAPTVASHPETSTFETKDTAPLQPPRDLMAELTQLQVRLAELETYISKLAALEGKSIAF